MLPQPGKLAAAAAWPSAVADTDRDAIELALRANDIAGPHAWMVSCRSTGRTMAPNPAQALEQPLPISECGWTLGSQRRHGASSASLPAHRGCAARPGRLCQGR